MELYYEETSFVQEVEGASKKYNLFKILSIVCFVLAGVWIFYTFNGGVQFIDEYIFEAVLITFVPMTACTSLGAFFWYIKNKHYIDYDYCFSSGEMIVSKIYKNSKRVGLIRFNAMHVFQMGRVGSKTFEAITKQPDVEVIKATFNKTPSKDCEFFYIAVTCVAKKKVVILDCTEKMIASVFKFSSKLVMEKEF